MVGPKWDKEKTKLAIGWFGSKKQFDGFLQGAWATIVMTFFILHIKIL